MAQFVTDAGLLRTLDMLRADWTHIGLQSGESPTMQSVLLDDESLRKEIIDPLTDGYTLVMDAFFDETEANGSITGYGVFGDGATDSLNTGTLMAATSANMVKTNADSLTVSAEITVRRVVT